MFGLGDLGIAFYRVFCVLVLGVIGIGWVWFWGGSDLGYSRALGIGVGWWCGFHVLWVDWARWAVFSWGNGFARG